MKFLQNGISFLNSYGIEPINLYCFGSHVYGTADENSDWDYVAVVDEMPECGSHLETDEIDFHFYTIKEFQHKLDEHDLRLIECHFNLPVTKIEKQKFTFTLDKNKLRQQISFMMNNSWDKGRKKIIIEDSFDLRIALKSLFHAIKTCGFGIQIANQGYISKFDEYNWFLADLWNIADKYDSLAKQDQREALWVDIKTKWQKKLYNDLRTRFKNLCPKENLNEKRKLLRKLFKKYKVQENKDLINDIIQELK